MSVRPDDMVFEPSFGDETLPTAEVRARAERREEALTGTHRGLLARLKRLAVRRRLMRKGAAIARGGFHRVVAEATSGVPGGARAAASGLTTTVGAIAVAGVVAAVVALRLGTGESFEGLGEKVNKMFLGDLDDEARAKMATKQQLQSDANIARIVGKDGYVNSQVATVGEELMRQNLQAEIGASALRSAYPVNNWLDIIILRARDALTAAWNSNGGQNTMERLRQNYQALPR